MSLLKSSPFATYRLPCPPLSLSPPPPPFKAPYSCVHSCLASPSVSPLPVSVSPASCHLLLPLIFALLNLFHLHFLHSSSLPTVLYFISYSPAFNVYFIHSLKLITITNTTIFFSSVIYLQFSSLRRMSTERKIEHNQHGFPYSCSFMTFSQMREREKEERMRPKREQLQTDDRCETKTIQIFSLMLSSINIFFFPRSSDERDGNLFA